jgi:hypothetical protein
MINDKVKLAYCDMIAFGIKDTINRATNGFVTADRVNYDLAPEGHMQSTTKFIEMFDENGTRYRVTVEQL